MKRIITLMVAVFAVAFASGCGSRDSGNDALVSVGETVPSFTVAMLDGDTVSIESLRGKTVLVNFWATWCPPCNNEMARVEKDIIDRFAGEAFVFLPVSRGENPEDVRAWRQSKGYRFDTGMDVDTAIFPLFAETGIPRNFVIDPDGKIVFCGVGYTPQEFDEMVDFIARTIEEHR